MIDLTKYDFLDFGAGFGGCLSFAQQKFGGVGLGVEAHKGRAEGIRKKGYACLKSDVTSLELPKKSVRYVTMSHLLEHLTSLQGVFKTIQLAVNTATEFVFIEGPAFDFDKYLEDRSLKFFWSNGHGHHTKLKITEILSIFTELNISDYSFQVEQPYVKTSSSDDIHALISPPNVAYYDKSKHPPKPFVRFDKKIYRSFIFYVWLSNRVNRKSLLLSRKKFKTVDIKQWI